MITHKTNNNGGGIQDASQAVADRDVLRGISKIFASPARQTEQADIAVKACLHELERVGQAEKVATESLQVIGSLYLNRDLPIRVRERALDVLAAHRIADSVAFASHGCHETSPFMVRSALNNLKAFCPSLAEQQARILAKLNDERAALGLYALRELAPVEALDVATKLQQHSDREIRKASAIVIEESREFGLESEPHHDSVPNDDALAKKIGLLGLMDGLAGGKVKLDALALSEPEPHFISRSLAIWLSDACGQSE